MAQVWQSTQANKILVKLGPNKVEVDLATQDTTEGNNTRPDFWRHPPSDLPATWQALPSTQAQAVNAKIVVLESSVVAQKLGVTPENGEKWPQCTQLGDPWKPVTLSFTRITLTGSDGQTHVLPSSASGKSRTLTFPDLEVTLRDDGEQWPATVTGIKVEGSLSGGSGSASSVDLLDQRFVPRPQSLDFTSSPAELLLTPNGLARFN